MLFYYDSLTCLYIAISQSCFERGYQALFGSMFMSDLFIFALKTFLLSTVELFYYFYRYLLIISGSGGYLRY